MPLFIVVHTTYTHIQIGLFKDNYLIDQVHEENKSSSKLFIPILQDLLTRTEKNLKDLSFIAAYQGPGPFTTLRVSLASVNGLAFASQLPLVGVDGLEAFIEEQKDSEFDYTIALLNAFGNDVYIGIFDTLHNMIIYKGYRNIAVILEELSHYKKSIKFIGNGADLYKPVIEASLRQYAYIPENNPSTCSINSVAQEALSQWKTGNSGSGRLLPLYLKDHPAQAK